MSIRWRDSFKMLHLWDFVCQLRNALIRSPFPLSRRPFSSNYNLFFPSTFGLALLLLFWQGSAADHGPHTHYDLLSLLHPIFPFTISPKALYHEHHHHHHPSSPSLSSSVEPTPWPPISSSTQSSHHPKIHLLKGPRPSFESCWPIARTSPISPLSPGFHYRVCALRILPMICRRASLRVL